MAGAARPAFLRWMAFISAAIYSLFWIRDDPSRVTSHKEVQGEVKARTGDRIAECWGIMDAQVDPGRYILGDELTVLDIAVTTMSRWAPGRRRFYSVAPRMTEVVQARGRRAKAAGAVGLAVPVRGAVGGVGRREPHEPHGRPSLRRRGGRVPRHLHNIPAAISAAPVQTRWVGDYAGAWRPEWVGADPAHRACRSPRRPSAAPAARVITPSTGPASLSRPPG